jgi:hypothetical protein
MSILGYPQVTVFARLTSFASEHVERHMIFFRDISRFYMLNHERTLFYGVKVRSGAVAAGVHAVKE